MHSIFTFALLLICIYLVEGQRGRRPGPPPYPYHRNGGGGGGGTIDIIPSNDPDYDPRGPNIRGPDGRPIHYDNDRNRRPRPYGPDDYPPRRSSFDDDDYPRPNRPYYPRGGGGKDDDSMV